MNNLYWSVYKQLEKEVLDLSYSVYFNDEQFEFIPAQKKCGEKKDTAEIAKKYISTPPYSLRIGDLIVRCANELESIIKRLTVNSEEAIKKMPAFKKERDITSATRLVYLNSLWQLEKKIVEVVCPNMFFEKEENKSFAPFNYKEDSIDDFWCAYNALKHNRSNETLYKGNIHTLLRILAALYLLNLYYKDQNKVFNLGVEDEVGYNIARDKVLDFSRGSEIFNVRCYKVNFSGINYESDQFQSATYIQLLNPWVYVSNLMTLILSGIIIGTEQMATNSSLHSLSWQQGTITHSRALTFRNSDGYIRHCEYSDKSVPALEWSLIGTLNINQRFDFYNYSVEDNTTWINRLEKELRKLGAYNEIQRTF